MNSLRISIILVFTLLISHSGMSQGKTNYKRGGSKFDVRMGVQAGITSPNFGGDEFIVLYDANTLEVYPDVIYDQLGGFTAGIYADIRLAEGFYVQPELNFLQMGTAMRRDVDLLNEDGNYTLTDSSMTGINVQFITVEKRLSYVSMPLLVQIPIDRGFHFTVGPQFAFKISENETLGTSSIADSSLTNYDFIDTSAPSLYKGFDIGGVFGMKFQMKSGLNFSLRYIKNFKNINRNEGLRILAREPSNTNQALVFSAAYTFLYNKRLKEDIGRRH